MTTNNNLLYEAAALKKSTDFYLNCNIGIESIDKISQAINRNPFYSKFYKESSPKTLISSYQAKIEYLKQQLFSSDQDEYITNLLEYIRYTVMNNDFMSLPDVIFFENLCNPSLTSALLGKGTSYSKCCFLKDLLPDNINSRIGLTIFFTYPNYYENSQKDYTVVIELQGKRYILNPDKYLGYRHLKPRLCMIVDGNSLEEYSLNPKTIESSRHKVSQFLIKENNIPTLLNDIINPNMDQEQVLNKLIEYITNNIIFYNFEVKHYSIILNDTLFEASKLFELLLIASSIPFKIVEDGQRQNTVFEIELDGIKRKVDLKSEIDQNKKRAKSLELR